MRISKLLSIVMAAGLTLGASLGLTPAHAEENPSVISAMLIGASFDVSGQTPDWGYPDQPIYSLTHRPVGYWAIAMSHQDGTPIRWTNLAQPGSHLEGLRAQALRLRNIVGPDRHPDVVVIGLTADYIRRPVEVRTFIANVVHTIQREYPGVAIVGVRYPDPYPITNEYVLGLSDFATYLYWRDDLDAWYRANGVTVADIWPGWAPRDDGFHPDEVSAYHAAARLNAVVRQAAGR